MGAIASMHIPVQNSYFLLPIFMLKIPGSYSNSIENAKPIERLFNPRVMARGSYHCKAVVPTAIHHPIDSQ